jgi:hypothetical protein
MNFRFIGRRQTISLTPKHHRIFTKLGVHTHNIKYNILSGRQVYTTDLRRFLRRLHKTPWFVPEYEHSLAGEDVTGRQPITLLYSYLSPYFLRISNALSQSPRVFASLASLCAFSLACSPFALAVFVRAVVVSVLVAHTPAVVAQFDSLRGSHPFAVL